MKKLIYAVGAGLLSGFAASLFLISLAWVSEFRNTHSYLVYGLPFSGLVIGYLYHLYGREIQPGTNLIIDEIHNPQKVLPLRMAPLIYFATLLTHLFGGSAGREGTAVQMGASLSDQLSLIFKIPVAERKTLLLCGMGSAFGAAIGAPFAGVFFGMEIVRAGKLRRKPAALLECALASVAAYTVTRICHASHLAYPHFSNLAFSWREAAGLLISTLLFAFIVRSFVWLTHRIESFHAKMVKYPPLRPFIGGILLLLLFTLLPWQGFEGLGLETIFASFQTPQDFSVFAIKLLLTALTLGSGFKGGEFIPLVFMGATSGSALSGVLQLDPQLLASLGFVAVFGAAAKAPLTCSILAVELFGWSIAPYAIIACYLSAFLSGNFSIYGVKSKSEYELSR